MAMKFEDIHLLKDEKKTLFSFRFRPVQMESEIKCFESLYRRYEFIKPNFSEDDRETRCPDGIYSISNQYLRYKIFLRKQRIHDLPNWIAITISLLSLALSVLVFLWQLGILLPLQLTP
ncbi:MAG: hypothetical protein Q4B26_10090 [Eubacteriales bacterium]|nr:hypothetical protein [Eubacteriales bacterium]